jgi:hypothetical protein
MKNKIKLFWIIALATIIGFSMMACGGDGTMGGKTPLATPSGVHVDADDLAITLKWNAVEGADSYTLDIDGELQSVSGSRTSYDLKALTYDPKVYPIKVRAVAYNGDPDHSDSAYSAPINVEPAEYIFEYEDNPSSSLNIRSSRNAARAVGDGLAITGLTNFGKTLEKIVIPPRIGSVTINAIGNEAFKDNEKMSSLVLPETIITIGAGAFSGTNIPSIIIPDSVLTIGDGAFSNCIVLVVVVFVSPEPPALGNDVFQGSTAIETIAVPDGSGDAYAETIAETAPELAETIEETKEEKLLIAIEVVQPPKTEYTAGESFSAAGMSVIARYSDNTTSTVTTYTVQLQTTSGGFSAQTRALTANDKAVRVSYTEGSITRTVDIAITVAGASYSITVNAGSGGTVTTDPQGSAQANTIVKVYINPNDGYYPADGGVKDANGRDVEIQFNESGNYAYFTMPASAITISVIFEQGDPGGPVESEYKINVDAEYGGQVTTNPRESAPAGTSVMISVRPDQGYELKGYYIMDANNNIVDWQANSSGYSFIMPASDVTIYVTFEQSGSGNQGDEYKIYVNDTAGGYITTNPSGNAPVGTTVTINVNPDQGYQLTQLEIYRENSPVDYQSTSTGGYFFTMPDSDILIIATFEYQGSTGGGGYEYNITVNAGNGGSITTNPSGKATDNTIVTINVSPNQGYYMASLSVIDDKYDDTISYQRNPTSSGNDSYTFTMPPGNVTITATFQQSSTQSYNITVNAGNGGKVSTNPPGNVPANTTVWINADPYDDYELASLYVYANSTAGGSGTSINYQEGEYGGYFFTMPASDVTISVTFKERSTGGTGGEYKITVNAGDGGQVTTNPPGNVPANTTVWINVSPNQGYTLRSLNVYANNSAGGSGDSTINYQTSTDGGYFFTMPASDVTISASFQQNTSGGPSTGGTDDKW